MIEILILMWVWISIHPALATFWLAFGLALIKGIHYLFTNRGSHQRRVNKKIERKNMIEKFRELIEPLRTNNKYNKKAIAGTDDNLNVCRSNILNIKVSKSKHKKIVEFSDTGTKVLKNPTCEKVWKDFKKQYLWLMKKI